MECTPAYLGRDPRLQERLARASGLHLLTNTGYYGAASDKYVPARAFEESPDVLARRWIKEWAEGIDGTAVRPGFVKTGVGAGPLSTIDRKLIHAAAKTHVGTGLTIASHTGDTRAARDELGILAEERVAPDAFIWVHAQSDWDLASRVEAARTGAWIEIDNVAPGTVQDCVSRVNALKQHGVLERILVSHDAGWYKPGQPGGGEFRGFDTLYTAFVPALERSGWTASDINQLLVANPAAAFTVRIRTTRAG
jgi:phosphotriesterase-related protein